MDGEAVRAFFMSGILADQVASGCVPELDRPVSHSKDDERQAWVERYPAGPCPHRDIRDFLKRHGVVKVHIIPGGNRQQAPIW